MENRRQRSSSGCPTLPAGPSCPSSTASATTRSRWPTSRQDAVDEDVDLSYSHCVYTTGTVGGLKQIVMGNQTAADLVTGTLYKKGKEIKGDFPSIPNATEQAIVSFVD